MEEEVSRDAVARLLFWTDVSTDKIERANMDGSNRLTVIGTDLNEPYGIAIDPEGNKLYWCDWHLHKIETSDLFGNFREILLQDSSVSYPYNVAVHAEYLYWTDAGSGYVKWINRYESGGSAEQVGSRLGTGIRGLHVYEIDECSSSPCQNNATCMDFINSFQCTCQGGFVGRLCEVQDNERPSVICPDDIDISTDSSQATVNWLYPIVTDNVDTGLPAMCTPSPSSSFNVGSTTVTCSATDTATNTGSCTFKVNVIVDNERPSVICPDDIDISTDSSQATVNWLDPVVTDNVDTALPSTCNQSRGASFTVGSTVVICFAIDAAGNEANCTFKVQVEGISTTSSVPGYLIVVVILCVIILLMSPAFIFFCRSHYSQKKKKTDHSTGMNMNDYDDVEVPTTTKNAAGDTGHGIPLQTIGDVTDYADVEVPKSTTNAADDTLYESTLQTTGDVTDYDDVEAPTTTTNAADNRGFEITLHAAAPPKLESQRKADSAYEDEHTYMSVESVYTLLKK